MHFRTSAQEVEAKYTKESPQPSTFEQLGQAIKFIGTFVSWARAINPSTTTEDGYARSNAAMVGEQPQQQQQQPLGEGLIGEPRVDSGGYC